MCTAFTVCLDLGPAFVFIFGPFVNLTRRYLAVTLILRITKPVFASALDTAVPDSSIPLPHSIVSQHYWVDIEPRSIVDSGAEKTRWVSLISIDTTRCSLVASSLNQCVMMMADLAGITSAQCWWGRVGATRGARQAAARYPN